MCLGWRWLYGAWPFFESRIGVGRAKDAEIE